MGRALILLVDENGVEYLPTLQTHSLDGVQVPESVVKEWRRRKGLGTTSSSAAATATTSAGQGQNAKAVASATRNGETGRHAPPATPHDVPGLSRCLQRIRKMVPLDERGIWLLNHLLSQTEPEDQEELCRSVQEKLRKRKVALVRWKDRLKLECDRRCVFTKAANEIRTASAMTAEINRCNVLATIVKDHNHAARRSDQKRRQKQRRGRTNSEATSGTLASPPANDRGGIESAKFREGRKGEKRSRARAGSKGRGVGHETQRSKEKRGLREEILLQPRSAPPPPLTVSTKMAKAPTSGVIVATSSKASEVAAAYPSAVASNSASWDRRHRGRTKPRAPHQKHGDVSSLSSSFEDTRSPTSRGSQRREASAVTRAGLPAADGKKGARHQNPRSTGGSHRLGLPPLNERYGESVVDSWVQSPIALRLERPRCKSVDVAHLDRQGYKEYLEGIVRAGAAAARQRGRKRRNGEEQGTADGETLDSSDMEIESIITHQRTTKAGRSTRFISDPVEQEIEGNCDGGLDIPPVSSIPTSSPDLGGPGRIDGGSGASAAAEPSLARSNLQNDSCTHGNPVRGIVDDSHAMLVSTAAALSRTASIRQLMGGRAGVFSLTSCDTESFPGTMASNVGGQVVANTCQGVPSGNAPCVTRADHGSSRRAVVDETLESEALGFRSKGARKVFKQTQRLLEALRTPAGSCQVDPRTGARRCCGGGNVGGHSSIVVHHHQNTWRSEPTAAGARGGKAKRVVGGMGLLGDLLGSDAAMWRAPRGGKPARLAEVFRCIAAPHSVHIESEIILHNTLARPGGERDGDSGGNGGGSGAWDDFVFAWECLADGILAGRALSGLWEHAHHDHGGANSALASSQRAADDLLSDGLMRALLSTRCYRPPGLDQLFVEWLDELLEVVRSYVRRACSRLPVQHGLTAGLEWFEEVCNDQSFLRRHERRRRPGATHNRTETTSSQI